MVQTRDCFDCSTSRGKRLVTAGILLLVSCAGPTLVAQSLFIRGDVNADGGVNLTDAVSILHFLFLGAAPPSCLDSADTDDTGTLDLTDAVYVLLYLFAGGPPPPPPFSPCAGRPNVSLAVLCGPDRTDDEIDCVSHVPCDRMPGRSLFSTPVTFAPEGIVALAPGDLDGDGDGDFAVLAGDGVQAFLNSGIGTFLPTTLLQFEGEGLRSGAAVAVEDLDHDGDAEVIVGCAFFNDQPCTFSVLSRTQECGFDLISTTPVHDRGVETFLLPMDLDGTGWKDMVVLRGADPGSSPILWSLDVFLHSGAATFQKHGDSISLEGSTLERLSIVSGDLDGDRKSDLILHIRTESSRYLRTLRNLGDGTFSPLGADIAMVREGTSRNPPVVADLNGDGAFDLSIQDSLDESVTVLFNDGQGSFGPPTVYSVPDEPLVLSGGDVDEDGDLDLVSSHDSNDEIHVLINDGRGSFSTVDDAVPPGRIGFTAGWYHLTLNDFDGDNHIDLALAQGFRSDHIQVVLGTGTGAFIPVIRTFQPHEERSVAFGDLNSDGLTDVAMLERSHLQVRKSLGGGLFTMPEERLLGDFGDSEGDCLVGDLDGDGDLDLLAAMPSPQKIMVALNDGGGGFAGPVREFDASFDPFQPVLADQDGDGDVDVILGSNNCKLITVLKNDGAGNFSDRRAFPITPSDCSNAVSFDSDGDTDLDLAYPAYPSREELRIKENINEEFSTERTIKVDRSILGIASGDFDGDRMEDIVCLCADSNLLFPVVLAARGNGNYEKLETSSGYQSPDSVWGRQSLSVADFDGDGSVDVATLAGIDGDGLALLWTNKGDGTFRFQAPYGYGHESWMLQIGHGDFDGDGWVDLGFSDVIMLSREGE